MDFEGLQSFLKDLGKISRVEFEVISANGTALLSGIDAGSRREDLEALAAQVIRDSSSRQAVIADRHVVAVPIRKDGVTVGSILASGINGRSGAGAPDHTESLLNVLSRVVGSIEERWTTQMESEEMAQELSQIIEHLYLYSRIAPRIKILSFSELMLQELTGELISTMRMDVAFACLPKGGEDNLVLSGNWSPDAAPFVRALVRTIPLDSPTLAQNYFLLTDSRKDPDFASLHQEPFRFLCVRIQHKKASYGWLGMVSANLKEIFRSSELKLLISIAEQLAGVISNTELYRDLERFVINIVESLVNAIEAKDVYTRGHSERVNRYSMLIAEALDMEISERHILHWAAVLHDIGKIGIPESILNKPDRLTKEEFDIVKAHPEKGYNILRPLEPLSRSLPAILHHHERFEGGGYPLGLRGEDIPLHARIIAVADCYDAVSSDRAYRQGRSARQALAVLEEVAGTQLDPRMVAAFKKIFPGIAPAGMEKHDEQ